MYRKPNITMQGMNQQKCGSQDKHLKIQFGIKENS